MDARLKLFKGNAQLSGSFAMSWLTKDVSDGPLSSDELQRIFGGQVEVPDPEKIEWLLILNQSTIPLPIAADTGKTINMKSLQGATNWDAIMRIKVPAGGIHSDAEIKYFYAGPHYTSLGNPLQQVNRAGWHVGVNTHLFDSKVLLKGNISWYDKDLYEVTGTPTGAVQASLSSMFSLRNDLPTLMLIGSLNDEHARTDNASDPQRANTFYTYGTALQYAPSFESRFKPSITISYYNSKTRITTSALDEPFSIRTHTALASLTTVIDDFPLEPLVNGLLNATTSDIPLTIGTASVGSRWRIIPKVVTSDFLLSYTRTNDAAPGKSKEYSVLARCRYELAKRQSLWSDFALKFNHGEYLDKRIKVNYEVRY